MGQRRSCLTWWECRSLTLSFKLEPSCTSFQSKEATYNLQHHMGQKQGSSLRDSSLLSILQCFIWGGPTGRFGETFYLLHDKCPSFARVMWVPPKLTVQVVIQGGIHFSFDHVFSMCSSATNVITSHPTPPHVLRSIDHVFKCNECNHIPPHPTCCVASTMCSSATNVITSHPTPPHVLRSIDHVFKCNECNHIPPHPTPRVA